MTYQFYEHLAMMMMMNLIKLYLETC